MFANNRKKLLRNLGKEQVPVEKPPTKEATETFWRNILENDREHNHSAEWIKREELKLCLYRMPTLGGHNPS